MESMCYATDRGGLRHGVVGAEFIIPCIKVLMDVRTHPYTSLGERLLCTPPSNFSVAAARLWNALLKEFSIHFPPSENMSFPGDNCFVPMSIQVQLNYDF